MIRFYRKFTLLILVFSVILSSCSSTNVLTLSVTEPAPVYIPNNIQKIGIVNRSLPSNKNIDAIDKILTAEGKNLDKKGAQKAILGLFEELNDNTIFSEVKIIENTELKSSRHDVFPSLLSWETIQNICTENNVDAVYILSFYDTDSRIKYNAVPVKINTPVGIKIPAIEHHATVTTLIKTGWRIYNPIDKIIHDEFIIHKNISLTGKGIDPTKALAALTEKKEAVLNVSNHIGHGYGLRILPYKIRVSRDYFVSGTDNFEIAKRRARTGDWDGAAELWNKEVSNPKSKIAGRAYYNMAIINEINGNLGIAVDWASKSYTDYKNKTALKYLKILKRRIRKNNLLQQQRQE